MREQLQAAGKPTRWRQVIDDYAALEPGEADSWTPLHNPFELSYRLCLFYALTEAVERAAVPVDSLEVLDVGCGNGRTTRMYLDLGLRPERLVGLDLRPGAIALAGRLNPSIRFVCQEGNAIPFPDASFSWASLITVFSSIQDQESRQYLIDEIHRKLKPGGHLFYFDRCRANAFGGGGRIDPARHATAFEPVWRGRFRSFRFLPATSNWRRFLAELRSFDRHWSGRLRGRIGQLLRPSHEALLLRR